jgi:hypothetical protein
MSRAIKILVLIVLSALVIGGCSAGSADIEPHISGIVADIGDNSILIVDGLDPADLPFDAGADAVNRAIWFYFTEDTVLVDQNNVSISLSDLRLGMPAQGWHLGFTAESHPEQATAVKIVVDTN